MEQELANTKQALADLRKQIEDAKREAQQRSTDLLRNRDRTPDPLRKTGFTWASQEAQMFAECLGGILASTAARAEEPEGERSEYVTCNECGREPIGDYPVAHEPSCSRMTLAPHLWPSHIPPTE